ncbi:MAG: DUF1326 domain-containing protein [Xanthomonadales bacterium]|nr:DUF1326 domain-containing protein [Xanthomonadales bacterium]
MIDWHIKGESFGACNCDHWCPCQFEGDPSLGHCQGVDAYRVSSGHFGDVDLSGVVAVTLYSWPGPIYKGGGTMQTIIGEGATPAQIDAIDRIHRGQETLEATNIWWVFHAMCDEVLDTLVKPIHLDIDIEARHGRLEIPGMLKCVGEPIRNPHDGAKHRVQIRHPEGIEFEYAEIGNSTTHCTGEIKLDLENRYAQFHYMDHTGKGPAHVR